MVVNPQEAMQRMYKRFAKTGRLISPAYAHSIGEKPSHTYNTLKIQKSFDGYASVDNSGQPGQPLIVLDNLADIVLRDLQLSLPLSREECLYKAVAPDTVCFCLLPDGWSLISNEGTTGRQVF